MTKCVLRARSDGGLPALMWRQAYQHDKINVVTVDAALGSLAVRPCAAAAVGAKPAPQSVVLSQVILMLWLSWAPPTHFLSGL